MKLQITIDGKTYAVEVEVLDEDENPGQPRNGSAFSTPPSMPAPGAYTPGQIVEVHSADEKQYRSPVTGLVIKVNVKPGQQVQPNETIVVLEAMKMETNITAHHAGKVKCVNVTPGVPVKLHQVLLELE